MTLSEDELAYHRRVIAALRAAQIAMQSWSAHLVEKYKLGPQDFIAEDGSLNRAQQTP
jgi:hypothetical protein